MKHIESSSLLLKLITQVKPLESVKCRLRKKGREKYDNAFGL